MLHSTRKNSPNVSFRGAACPERSEGSDEESLIFITSCAERFLAALGMTVGIGFFRKLFSRAVKRLNINAAVAAGARVYQRKFSAPPRFPQEERPPAVFHGGTD
jgi:hypothetical protein